MQKVTSKAVILWLLVHKCIQSVHMQCLCCLASKTRVHTSAYPKFACGDSEKRHLTCLFPGRPIQDHLARCYALGLCVRGA